MPDEAKRPLTAMKDLYEKIKKRSIENGELDFDLPEPLLVRDKTGRVTDVVNADRGVANMIIEQFMIAANRAVGMRLRKNGSGVYRVHEPPTEESTAELVSDLRKLGYKADMPKKGDRPRHSETVARFQGEKRGKFRKDAGSPLPAKGGLLHAEGGAFRLGAAGIHAFYLSHQKIPGHYRPQND